MMQPTVTVDLGALAANWRTFASGAPDNRIAGVVKADAYGLGASRIGPALLAAGCRRFYVAWPSEGAALRTLLGNGVEIAVLLGGDAADFPILREAQLEPVLNHPGQAQAWMAAGGAAHAYSVHVDTGMNRLGASSSDWRDLSILAPRPNYVISHLASAEDRTSPDNPRQLNDFLRAADLWPGRPRSLAASAGAWLGAPFAFGEIRAGIGLFGAGPPDPSGRSPIPVARLSAAILQLRLIERGETVGYGGSFTAGDRMRLATLGVGYADGLPRSASNRGFAVIGGERRAIVGRVSMDLTTVDATGLDAKVGDEAELFGPTLPIDEQAQALGTISYELLTGLGTRTRRLYLPAIPS
jgi:alanine racemase